MNFDEKFVEHRLHDEVLTPNMGSWLIKQPDRGEYWARIVAANRYVVVFGDFEPAAFAYGSGDPRSLVNWIAHANGSYLIQKACIGSGRHAVYEYDVDTAKQQIKDALVSRSSDDDDDPACVVALRAGDEFKLEEDGEYGCHLIMEAMREHDPHVYECFSNFGCRVRDHVHLAAAAVRRLNALLCARQEDGVHV